MSVIMDIAITTNDGCFDEFHAFANEELAFTRGLQGCTVSHISSFRNTNTAQFAEIWDSDEDFNT